MENLTLDKGRIDWLDRLKGFTIFLVVLGHAICVLPGAQSGGAYYELMRWIYGFHMPLFTVISGYFLKDCDSPSQLLRETKKALVRYIIPYFIFGLISLLIYIAVQALQGTLGLKNVLYRLCGLGYSIGQWIYIPYCSTIYYLTALFCALFIFRLISLVKNKKLCLALIILCAALGHAIDIIGLPYSWWNLDSGKLPWNLDTALIMVGFLALGRLMRSLGQGRELRHPLTVSLGLMLLGVVFIMTNKYFGIKEMSFDSAEFGGPVHMWLGAAASVMGIFIIFKSFSGRWGRHADALLSFWGKNTLIIMACDQLIRDFLSFAFKSLGLGELWLLRLLLELLLQLPFIFLWNRFWPRLLRRLSRERTAA